MAREALPIVATNLLLVDDHPRNLTALEAILEPLGQNLLLATSGRDALKHLLNAEFSAILLDVQMPGMDGFETAELIKGRQRSHHIPILFLTALSKEKAHVERGYSVGAVDYISKPFDPDILRSKVAVFVELFQKNDRLKRQSDQLHAKRDREVVKLERASKERYQALAESMPQIVWTAAQDGSLTYGNPRWYACAGVAEKEAGGLHWQDLLHPDDLAALLGDWQAVIAGDGHWQGEYRFGNALVGYRWHLVRAVSSRDKQGRLASWIGTSTDIDDHKQAEAKLLLERIKLEAANRAKDEFLAMASHELRTPLNAMLGWTQILRAGRIDQSKVHGVLETIERNAKQQAQLITDLLDVSAIVTGHISLDFSDLSLAQVVQGAAETAYPIAEAAKVALVVQLDSTLGRVRGDALRLQQVVGNLLANAIHFTPAGGRVEVDLLREQGSALLRVSDSGRGIAPEFLPYVFERFHHADDHAARSRKGLGLGLAIAKHLVELHGGVVTATSEGKDKGCTLLVTLPLLPAPIATRRSEAKAGDPVRPLDTSSLSDIHVLIVEDDDDGREMLRAILEAQGARVSAASEAASAFELLQTNKPDVLVSDIGLPGEDGYALLERMRALSTDQGGMIPAIALTAYTSVADRTRALAAGFQLHLSKPCDPETLSQAIARLARGPKVASGEQP